MAKKKDQGPVMPRPGKSSVEPSGTGRRQKMAKGKKKKKKGGK